MTSKQEKLAAARRKLKEFQGKSKEGEISKQKILSDNGPTKSLNDISSALNDSLPCASPVLDESGDGRQHQLAIHHNVLEEVNMAGENLQRKISFSSESSSPRPWPDGNQYSVINKNFMSDVIEENNKNKEDPAYSPDFSNGLITNPMRIQFQNSDEKNNHQHSISYPSISRSSESPPKLLERNNENSRLKIIEAKDFLNNDANSQGPLDDLIKPLQMELQNHAQTISILVQQRNEAQSALTQTQNLLAIKSGEVEELTQKVSYLSSFIKHHNNRHSEAEESIKAANEEKEESVKKLTEAKTLLEKLQADYNSKEEELSEVKKKYEDKNSECQKLFFSLQETQSQLSLSQIQIQQFSTEGHSALAVQLSELQNENLNLKQKIVDLEKKLEAENVEKEQSSQKFHVYAQQCNSQLSSLNFELNALKAENERLTHENTILSKSLSDEENVKEKNSSSQSFEEEIGDLHNQVSALTEENHQLQCALKKQEEESINFQSRFEEKEVELRNLAKFLKELEEENKKLLLEAETPKANERLLATMESDKVAAAKAVSQNQKLKEQIVELEKAFMKMSQEKLELTDQLAHEKHVNSELQNLLKNAKSDHHDHHDHNGCHHDNSEPLVNDSNEIEELRNIVRQLQDDKIELKARLSSYESIKEHSSEENEMKTKCEHDHNHSHEHNHEENETQCENTKLLLQQMEEKVRKTMNEIAILDEEKEKLEHLVLQLQGETETIGEYITLYQKQRMLLRQRAQEKDSQLEQLSKDKEELKCKLASLDELVQKLIAERENFNIQSDSKPLTSSSEIPNNTAGKIRALINEIGSTTLINNHSVAFEHCSCCSGRLITI